MSIERKIIHTIDGEEHSVVVSVRRDPVSMKIPWADVHRFASREEMRQYVSRELGMVGADLRFGHIEITAATEPGDCIATWCPW